MLESSRKNLRSSSSGSVLRSGDQQVYAQKKSQVHKHSSRNAATHHLNLQQSSLNVAVRYHVSRAYSFAKQLHFRKNVPPPPPSKKILRKSRLEMCLFSVYCGLCLLHFSPCVLFSACISQQSLTQTCRPLLLWPQARIQSLLLLFIFFKPSK